MLNLKAQENQGLKAWLFDTFFRHPGRRVAAVVISLAVHLGLFLAVLQMGDAAPKPVEAVFVTVSMVEAPPAAPAGPAPEPAVQKAAAKVKAKAAPPSPPKTAPVEPKIKTRPVPPAPGGLAIPVQTRPSRTAPPGGAPELSDADLAGAGTAANSGGQGGAPGGRRCNMIQYLQGELRRNRGVQTALAARPDPGKASFVWNGAWLRSTGEEGEGLAVIRQALMVHIAFAPEACRADPVKGLVLITLGDAPGSPRIALGRGQWKWSDLLGVG